MEKGNQIFVRVGGGYLNIDEFIAQYSDIEVDKIQRHNVIDKFQAKTMI